MRSRRRLFLRSFTLPPALVLAIALVACGGSADSVGPGPGGRDTTRVPTPVATSIEVLSGADQTADPGTTVATAPVVVVRDVSGAAMGGVAVQFTVSAGGGEVAQGSAVTTNDGRASPGAWRLGPAEGRNELRISAGTIAPVLIGATAVVTTRTVADTTLASGTITVSSDGPLKGATLTVPTGAYTTAGRWTLAQQPTASWSTRANLNMDPVALRITGTASGLAKQPLTLTLPATPVDGQKTFAIMRDPVSGGLMVLTTIAQTDRTITVSTNHFSGAFIVPPASSAASALRRAAAFFSPVGARVAAGYDAVVVVAKIPVAELDKDYDTGFRPGVDDWEFRPLRTAIAEEPMDLGKSIGSLVYFAYFRGQGALYNRYQLEPGVEFSNRAGIRASAYLQQLLPTEAMLGGITAIRTSTREGAADQIFYDVLKANLFVTGLPQLLVAEFRNPAYSVDEELRFHMKFLTVYRTSGAQVFFADPYRPGNASLSVPFVNGRFSALTIPVGDAGRTLTADNVDAVAPGSWLHMGALQDDLGTILNGGYPEIIQVGDRSLLFPEYRLKVRRPATIRDTLLYLPDTTRLWVECNDCAVGMRNAELSPSQIEPFNVYRGATLLGSSLGSGLKILKAASRDERLGIVVLEGNGGPRARWVDWTTVRAKQWSVAFTPAEPRGAINTELSFAAALTGPSLPLRTYVWNFNDGTALVNTEGESRVAHRFAKAGEYYVVLSVLDAATSDLIARDSVKAVVGTPSWAGWRISSLTLAVADPYRHVLIDPGNSPDTRWSVFKSQAVAGSIEDTFIKQVALDSTELFGIARGTLPGAVIYLDKDTLTRNPGNSRAYNSTRGLYLVVGNDVPSASQVMAYSLDPFFHQLASNSTWGGVTARSCNQSWDWGFTATGAPLTGTASMSGAAWSDLKSAFPNAEPRRRPSITATVESNGDLVGSIVLNYRLSVPCPLTPAEQVQWSITGTFRGVRIR